MTRAAMFAPKRLAETIKRARVQMSRAARVALAMLLLAITIPQQVLAQEVAPAAVLAPANIGLLMPTSFPTPFAGPVVIDYTGTYTSATPARLKKAGVGVVIRYVGASRWKSLTRSEANGLRSAGIDVAAVYETDAKWMLHGRKAGIVAAKKARAAVIACGGPRTPFIWFACDTATSNFAAVNACLQGAASVLGADHVGIYGSYTVCASALKSGYATKAWQTLAWSGGKVLAKSVLYQNARSVHGDLHLNYDSNFARDENVGQWGYAAPGTVAWTVQPTPTDETLRAVDFVGGTSGWAVGDEGTVLRTADTGATWAEQSTPTTATLRSIDFASSSVGWAVGDGGTILGTGDAGATWVAQSSPTTAALTAVRFTDAATGWAVGQAGTALHTTDGGVMWVAQSTPTSETLAAVSFASGSTGWAVGGSGTVLRSLNGGATWTKQSSPTTAALTAVHFADADTGWAVGAKGTILSTTNGGTSWKLQSAPTTETLNSVHFVDAVQGWATGDSGTVLQTADGGATWVAQFAPTTAALRGVRFTSSSNGWAVGDGGTILRANTAKVSAFGTISGVVTDAATGAPLSGISVKIGSQPTAATAPDGTFIAARLKPGTYTVSLSNSRYISRAEMGVVVTAGLRSTVKTKLTAKTATALTRPIALPAGPLSTHPVTLNATISPAAAATSAATVISGSRYEQKIVKRKYKGKIRKSKVWYWHRRFNLTMTPGIAGSLAVPVQLASGTWRIEVKYPGSGTYLPSTSGARVYVK